MEEKKTSESKTAFGLFVKLYTRKLKKLSKAKGNTAVIEATRSWITLSDEDKQIFVNKFKECKEKQKEIIAENLRQMQPYMKKKKQHLNRIHRNDKDSKNPTSTSSEEEISFPDEITQEMNFDLHNEKNVSRVNPSPSQSTVILDNDVICSSSKDDEYTAAPAFILNEPAPPQIRNSKELFELIKDTIGMSNVSWSSLPISDKKHYQKAVAQLKKDYIRNYKLYLESLSPKELFEYYHSFVM